MRTLTAALILSLAVAGVAAAQSSPFDGVWMLDQSKSKTYSYPLPPREVLTLRHANNAETGTNDITNAEGERSRSQYTATFNDGKWYPSKNLDTGEESGSGVMMIRLDDRNEMRFGRRADGTFSNMLLRSVSEDGKSLHVMWYSEDGSIIQDLHFDKQ